MESQQEEDNADRGPVIHGALSLWRERWREQRSEVGETIRLEIWKWPIIPRFFGALHFLSNKSSMWHIMGKTIQRCIFFNQSGTRKIMYTKKVFTVGRCMQLCTVEKCLWLLVLNTDDYVSEGRTGLSKQLPAVKKYSDYRCSFSVHWHKWNKSCGQGSLKLSRCCKRHSKFVKRLWLVFFYLLCRVRMKTSMYFNALCEFRHAKDSCM